MTAKRSFPLKTLSFLSGLAAIGLSALSAQAESAYGCSGIELNNELAAIEGKDGVFFRINTDLRMNHPFSDTVVSQLGELSRALAGRGTTLVFVPIPTKSVTMPQYLPESAGLYGFDLDVATEVHVDILDRLTAEGVETVDIREWLLKAAPDKLAFFNSDFHWSAYGADLGAQGIAEVVRSLPAYQDATKTTYETVSTGEGIAFSGMRRILQKRCQHTLPEPTTGTFETTATEMDLGDLGLGTDTASEGTLDLFGDTAEGPAIALVGTSFSDSPINNFPGFIAQHSSLEVVNYAITGGNQFGAITSFLTSPEFQDAPPKFLIWENPVYNNLAQYGDQPMRELIAAAGQSCVRDLQYELSEDRKTLRADISELSISAADTLFFDSDNSLGLAVDFEFRSHNDLTRKKLIRRGERLRRTGRFYMPLAGLWPDGAQRVDISISAPVGANPQLVLCPAQLKEIKS